MGATGLDFPIDLLQRAHYFRAKAEEFREQANDATLSSVRESYSKWLALATSWRPLPSGSCATTESVVVLVPFTRSSAMFRNAGSVAEVVTG
jgi:hypothetical protein